MSFLIKFILGKVSGPFLVYVVLGLFAANAITGTLLKSAWKKNAQAVLVCENQALRDAADANAAVAAELKRLQEEQAAYRESIRIQTREIEKEIAENIRAMEIQHEEQIANLQVATNEITDDEFFCASEPVAVDQLDRMRDAVTAYHKNRIDHSR